MKSLARNCTFFGSKKKNKKQNNQHSNSRSMSSYSDFGKKSARPTQVPQKKMPLSQKEKEIREAVEYRFVKSKNRDFRYEQTGTKKSLQRFPSRSSQQEEFREMKRIKYVNLKQYHEKAEKMLKEQQSNKIKSKVKMRGNGSLIIKTEPNQLSKQKGQIINPYLRMAGKKGNNRDDWKFISIQFKQKQKSKSKSRDVRINSHRTLMPQTKSTEKMKSFQSKWAGSTKLKDLGKLAKKYRF